MSYPLGWLFGIVVPRGIAVVMGSHNFCRQSAAACAHRCVTSWARHPASFGLADMMFMEDEFP
jgi:hypothetical protein